MMAHLNAINYGELLKDAAGAYAGYKRQEQALELQKQQLKITEQITRQKQLEQQAAIRRLEYQRALQYAGQQGLTTGIVSPGNIEQYIPWIIGGGLVLLFIRRT